MNLVLSGPIDDNLRNAVAALSRPRDIVRLHARAFRFEGADETAQTRAQVADLCDAARVDHAYIEEGKRLSDFKLLAMDMDSTLITIECIDEIADFAGKKEEVAAITAAAMRGEMDFAESLRRRVALLAGTRFEILEQVFTERLQLSPGATALLAEAKSKHLFTLLVSGGFTYFTRRLQSMLSFNEAHANDLEIKDQQLTGKILGPVLDSTAKAASLTAAMNRLSYRRDQCIAIGDGANDAKMIAEVDSSVAYHAKPALRVNALLRIDFGGLDVLLDYYPA